MVYLLPCWWGPGSPGWSNGVSGAGCSGWFLGATAFLGLGARAGSGNGFRGHHGSAAGGLDHPRQHGGDRLEAFVRAVCDFGVDDAMAGEQVECGTGLSGGTPRDAVEPGLVAGRELGYTFGNVERDRSDRAQQLVLDRPAARRRGMHDTQREIAHFERRVIHPQCPVCERAQVLSHRPVAAPPVSASVALPSSFRGAPSMPCSTRACALRAISRRPRVSRPTRATSMVRCARRFPSRRNSRLHRGRQKTKRRPCLSWTAVRVGSPTGVAETANVVAETANGRGRTVDAAIRSRATSPRNAVAVPQKPARATSPRNAVAVAAG